MTPRVKFKVRRCILRFLYCGISTGGGDRGLPWGRTNLAADPGIIHASSKLRERERGYKCPDNNIYFLPYLISQIQRTRDAHCKQDLRWRQDRGGLQRETGPDGESLKAWPLSELRHGSTCPLLATDLSVCPGNLTCEPACSRVGCSHQSVPSRDQNRCLVGACIPQRRSVRLLGVVQNVSRYACWSNSRAHVNRLD